jgi:hypothetical protein
MVTTAVPVTYRSLIVVVVVPPTSGRYVCDIPADPVNPEMNALRWKQAARYSLLMQRVWCSHVQAGGGVLGSLYQQPDSRCCSYQMRISRWDNVRLYIVLAHQATKRGNACSRHDAIEREREQSVRGVDVPHKRNERECGFSQQRHLFIVLCA